MTFKEKGEGKIRSFLQLGELFFFYFWSIWILFSSSNLKNQINLSSWVLSSLNGKNLFVVEDSFLKDLET